MIAHAMFMEKALAQAKIAASKGDVPVGAVVVAGDKVIGAGYNRRERDQDPTAHAEILALRQASQILGSWRAVECRLYVTLEPCPMCAGALVNARIPHLVFGARDPKAGAIRSLYAIGEDPRLNHRLEVTEGVMATECSAILKDFFSALRSSKIE
jgi:tRNA(adenine34) deaminase